MSPGHIIWADLSTFDLPRIQAFYHAVMGWEFSDYYALKDCVPVAGLYTMPDKFQAIGMPSFWMSYISTDSLARCVELAESKGGRTEIQPTAFGEGQIALIRDPLGAGFTVFEGPDLGLQASGSFARMGHALFVSDAAQVRSFYTTLFGWRFGESIGGTQSICAGSRQVATLHEIPDDALRGKEQYWAVLFAVPDLRDTSQRVLAAGGHILADTSLPEGPAILVCDPNGGAFFAVEEVRDAAL